MADIHRERTFLPCSTRCRGCQRELQVHTLMFDHRKVTCCGYEYAIELEAYLVVSRPTPED